jgi:hypothetical protein
MPQRSTDNDFDRMTWHDNTLYGLRFDIGDTQRNQWHSNLVLDLDHIVEWVRDADGDVRFRVVPATLVFHDVTDLRIDIDFADSACRTAINEPSIDGITRQPVSDRKICLDRAYYRWRIAFNWPRGGEIAFGASGFTQTWRAEPRLLDQQRRGRFAAIGIEK